MMSFSELIEELERGARAAGFASERWTQARIQALIQRKWELKYHQNYINCLLYDLGWNVQKPENRTLGRDEGLIAAWISRDWPRIKKPRRATSGFTQLQAFNSLGCQEFLPFTHGRFAYTQVTGDSCLAHFPFLQQAQSFRPPLRHLYSI